MENQNPILQHLKNRLPFIIQTVLIKNEKLQNLAHVPLLLLKSYALVSMACSEVQENEEGGVDEIEEEEKTLQKKGK